jgi:hypothetical protein
VKVTITSIELKGPFSFFLLSARALKIIRQLKGVDCLAFKKQGFWTMHYTMTLWRNDEELKQFAYSGAHLQAMRDSARIAREIRTITIDADALPAWKEAKALLKGGKVMRYGV